MNKKISNKSISVQKNKVEKNKIYNNKFNLKKIKKLKSFISYKFKNNNMNKNNVDNYFSKDYFEARKKFRVETKKIKGAICWSEKVTENLTVDFAFCDSSDNSSHSLKSDKLLIIVSGVHGVEGYTGSAFQLNFIDNIYPFYKNDFAILLIHAYNPFGFKNNRRVNENNVDLNRNCLKDFSEPRLLDIKSQKVFTKNSSLFSSPKPRGNNLIEESKYGFLLAKATIRHGISATITAGTFGQNIYPQGPGFVGTKEEKSTTIFKNTLKQFTPKFKKVLFVDIHTGIGRKNVISAYTQLPKESIHFSLLKKSIKQLKSKKSSRIKGLNHFGSTMEYFQENSKAKENITLLLEIGTVSNVSSALSLASLSRINLEENQITHFGPKYKLESARKRLKKAYFPNAKRHRRLIIKKSTKLVNGLCVEFRKM